MKEMKQTEMDNLIRGYSLFAGAAWLLPIPGVAVLASAGTMLAMYHAVNHASGINFAGNKGKCIGAFIGSLIPGMGWALALGLAKLIPGMGTAGSFLQCLLTGSGAYTCGMTYSLLLKSMGVRQAPERNPAEAHASPVSVWRNWRVQSMDEYLF